MQELKVSVFCLAYNHEKYIRHCLEGFVMQKTNFRYEVLINDDASTDKTAEIIREYQEKYPDIIKPIYQKENQYSKGIKIIRGILSPLAKGKYFAFCEGDDCWTDENKLQIQFDFMENNKKYSACSHKTKVEYYDGGFSISPNFKKSKDITFEQIAFFGRIETSSFFMKREVYQSVPNLFRAKSFGDHQLFLHSATCGKIRCINRVMSLYRKGIPGSWSDRTKTKEQIYHFYCEHIELAQKMMDYYQDKKVKCVLEKRKNLLMTYNFIYQEDEKLLKEQPYNKIHKQIKRKEKRKRLRNKFFNFLKKNKMLMFFKNKIKK